VKTTKTIVIIDYNTHKLTDLLDILTETYPVSLVSPQHLSDLPIPTAKILSVVILCMTPDATILQAIQKLKMYHGHLAIAVLSPKPSTAMITEALTTGATDYFDLSEDEPIRLFQWLNQLNNTQRTPSVWRWLLALLYPKRAIYQPIVGNKLLPIEPVVATLMQTFKDKNEAPVATTDLIEVQFFGEFSVKINGRLVASKSNGLLLAYLLFNHKQPVHKEKLMSKFWGENVNDAKNCLNVAICSLRKTLKELVPEKTPIILFQNDYYALNTAYWRIETDIDQFTQRWEKSRTLLRTQGLAATVEELKSLKTVYRDEFLPHFNHEWAVGKRDEYREKYLQALNLLSEHYWKTQEFNDCIACCQDILLVDECVESTHVRLMGCFIQLKMKDRAVRQYKKCVEAMQKLNMTPERETEHLYQSILMA
jgi:DNA-binding SARP family transcriptional activator